MCLRGRERVGERGREREKEIDRGYEGDGSGRNEEERDH